MKIPKVGIYTGSSIRHKYFIDTINKSLNLQFVIKHKNFKPIPYDLILWNHFWRNRVQENKYMGNYKKPKCEIYLSADNVIYSVDKKYRAVINKDIDYLLIFGSPILDERWCKGFEIINLHLGKSSRYRGTASFFWTYYNNEEYKHLASTIHRAVEEVDAGPILTRIYPDKVTKDYYKTTNKLIKKSIDEFPITVLKYYNMLLRLKKQNIDKRKYYYKNSDFNVFKLMDMLLNHGINCL